MCGSPSGKSVSIKKEARASSSQWWARRKRAFVHPYARRTYYISIGSGSPLPPRSVRSIPRNLIISSDEHWPLTPSPALRGGGWGGGAASAVLVACVAAIPDRWIFARSFPHPDPPPRRAGEGAQHRKRRYDQNFGNTVLVAGIERWELQVCRDFAGCKPRHYTGNLRFWCARPLMAEASLCPAITRTPSSMRAITLSAVQPCRKATPLLRQAKRTRSRATCISIG